MVEKGLYYEKWVKWSCSSGDGGEKCWMEWSDERGVVECTGDMVELNMSTVGKVELWWGLERWWSSVGGWWRVEKKGKERRIGI